MSSDAGKLMDYLTQTGFSNQINFSMTSGNDKGSSYMSVNYTNDKSVLKNNNSDAVNFRLNGDYNVLPLLKMGIRSYVKMGRSKGIDNSSERRVVWKPLTYESDPYNTGYWNSFGNPLAACDPKYSRSDSEFLSANLSGYADLDLGFLTKGLGFRSELNYSRYSNGNSGWTSELIGSAPETAAYGSYGTETTNFGKSILYNFYLKYNRSFGNHNVNAVLGTESERSMGYYRYAKGRNTEGSYPQLGDNPGEKIASSGYQSGEDYLRSYFGRLDYKFKDRYLAGISLRRDGASNFAPKKRWGTFTAYSLGWIINEESFLKDQKWISLLKLRGSAGQTGNKAVPNKFYTTWQSNLWWFYGEYGPASIGGTRPTNIGNSELTWETTTSYDFGLDYSFFNNKLNGSLGYYLQDVKGLVLAAQLPTSTGLGTSNEIWGNMGRIQNYGLEFSLTSVNVSTKDFQWTTNFNFTTNKNKVKALTPDLDNNNLPLYETKNGIQTISKTGHGIREFYMCESAGVDPERGVEMIYEIDYDLWKKTGEIVKTGRKIPATVDNINRNKVNLGKSTIPKFFGGINNTLQYRDFDMNFLITFAGGNYLYDTERYFISYPLRGQYNLDKALLTESWQKPGDNAKYPQLVYNETFPYDWDPEVANSESPTGKGNWKSGNGNYLVSGSAAPLSKFVEKAGYARLKHVEFGYTLPTLLSKKAWISSLRLFVSGDDLLTLTPYKGWDPVSGDITNGVLAITNLSPSFKVWASYNFGIQIKF
jgi:TonB-linked SusC/RagA family outer membrane protein